MNKADLVNALAKEGEMSKKDAYQALNAITGSIIEALISQDKVRLDGVGVLSVYDRKEREGIIPSTNERITIPARKVVKFRASNELSERMQN